MSGVFGMNWRKVISSVLMLTIIAGMSGCSLFAKKSRLEADKMCGAFEDYDAEEYDDLDEFEGDLENHRCLLAGMYIRGDGKYVRHIMSSDAINLVMEDAGENVIDELYTKKAEEIAFLIQGEEDEEKRTDSAFAVFSLKFDSEDEAWKYYRSCNDLFDGYADEDEDIVETKDYLSDDDLECTVTLLENGRNINCYCAYIEGKCVAVMIGHECGCNAISDLFDDMCDPLGIPAPDIDDYDFTTIAADTDRFMTAVEYYGATEVDYGTSSSVLGQGCVYCIVDDVSGRSDYMLFGSQEEYAGLIDEMKLLVYSPNGRASMGSGMMVFACYETADKNDAQELYDSILDDVNGSFGAEDIDIDSGIEGTITYTRIDMMGFMTYNIYLEENSVYIIYDMCDSDILDVTGLP